MPHEPAKRTAIEVPGELLDEAPAAVHSPRPSALVIGAVFVVIRAAGGVLWILSFASQWGDIRKELDAGSASDVVFWSVIGFQAVATAILLLLAWLLWRGSDRARLFVLIWMATSITASAVGYFSTGEEITIRTTLVTLALDILGLLALTGRDTRSWTRERSAERRRARRRG